MAVDISTTATTAKARVKQKTEPAKARRRRSSKFMANLRLVDGYITHQTIADVNIHSQIILGSVFAMHRTHVRLAHNTYSVKALYVTVVTACI